MNDRCVGLITRGVAFALDAAIVNTVATVVGIGVALIVSILHVPSSLRPVGAAIGGATYVLWSVGYFVGFWSTTGQTPGNRIMRIRVVAAKGERLKPRRALLRCIGVILAALPLFAGFALIVFDRRRRGLHDLLARTLVVEAPELSLAEQRRRQKRRIAAATRSPETGDDRLATPGQA